jgi:hypothetical protein
MQELPKGTGRRQALLIATSSYSDPDLSQLRAPGRDAGELAEVLRDPRIGGFEVHTELNPLYGELLEKIEDFCANRHPNDQLLVYLSCHGVLDANGRLYYAATNTQRRKLAATAVAASWLNERLEDCRARRQIIILDCCHSGAFARDAKGDTSLDLQQRFQPRGRGRVVLTASRSTEYAFEGGQAVGGSLVSVFTHTIITGLRTGDADRDEDGLITVSDLYHYVYDNVRAVEPRQTPELWTYGAEGDLLVAHSVRGAQALRSALPDDPRITKENPRTQVSPSDVAELAGLLKASVPSLAQAARDALQSIAESDLPAVAALARAALAASPNKAASQVPPATTEHPGQKEQARREPPDKGAERLTGPRHRKPETDNAQRQEGNPYRSATKRNGAGSVPRPPRPRTAPSAFETMARPAETGKSSSAPGRDTRLGDLLSSSYDPAVKSGVVLPRSDDLPGPSTPYRSHAVENFLATVGSPVALFAFLCIGTAIGQRSDVPHLGPGNWIAYTVSILVIVIACFVWFGMIDLAGPGGTASDWAIGIVIFGGIGMIIFGWLIGSHIGLGHLGVDARDWLAWRF